MSPPFEFQIQKVLEAFKFYFFAFFTFFMAYGRSFYRRYYRGYYRRKYRNSASKIRMSRNFKASAQNMTQGGTFNISTRINFPITLSTGSLTAYLELFVSRAIFNSPMHRIFSCGFDQYRVEKCSIKVRYTGNNIALNDATDSADTTNPAILFSCVDRTGFQNNIPIDALRTYGSYRETQLSGARDVSPVHYVPIGQSNLVEYTTYHDSKEAAPFPHVYLGVNVPKVFSSDATYFFSVEIDSQVRYRGVRLDTSGVNIY